MRNTSVEDSGYYYCELMVRGKEPIIEEVTKLTGMVPSGEMLQFPHVEHAQAISTRYYLGGGNAGKFTIDWVIAPSKYCCKVRHSHP